MPNLPNLTPQKRLPAGDYELTLDELRESFLVQGPPGFPNWDVKWRLFLVDNLETLVRQLWQVGITEIFIDGSFVEGKNHPNDIDGYFVCDLSDWVGGKIRAELNLLDPHRIWEQDSVVEEMRRHYLVELHPHYGQGSGIRDKAGNQLTFPAAFRRSRGRHMPRGIVKIGGPS